MGFEVPVRELRGRLRESADGRFIQSNDSSLVVAVSGSTARRKNAPGLLLAMVAFVVLFAGTVILAFSGRASLDAGAVAALMVAALAAVAFVTFMWLLAFRTVHVAKVDSIGIVHEMFVGPFRLVHQETPWSQVSEVSGQPASARGRVMYVGPLGSGYIGVGGSDDEAARILESMKRLRALADAGHA